LVSAEGLPDVRGHSSWQWEHGGVLVARRQWSGALMPLGSLVPIPNAQCAAYAVAIPTWLAAVLALLLPAYSVYARARQRLRRLQASPRAEGT
jgi:hypothetical protein